MKVPVLQAIVITIVSFLHLVLLGSEKKSELGGSGRSAVESSSRQVGTERWRKAVALEHCHD